MTPAERVVLAALAATYERWDELKDNPQGYGPYGVTYLRTGVESSRVAEIEEREVGWIKGEPSIMTARRIRHTLGL